MSGIELSRRFYVEHVAPVLGDRPHAAALLGNGSEVLGFDDDVSPDHDFGARVQVFLPPGGSVPPGLDGLPGDVAVGTAGEFFAERLGVDPVAGMGLVDWVSASTQVLGTLTAGAVFHDPGRELAVRREAIAWYPDDVWRYALAAGWLRVGQEEAFVGRTGSTGDDLGSRIVAGRLVRELIRLAFLVQRRWAPYSKWLGRAFRDLPIAGELGPFLREALAADDWRKREDALVRAASVVAAATNALGLSEPEDPSPRQYYDRDLRVLGAERFTTALTRAITGPDVRALLDRVGTALPGTIDQAVDSTDVLMHPGRRRAIGAVLTLG